MLKDSPHFEKMFRLYWSLLRTSWKLFRKMYKFCSFYKSAYLCSRLQIHWRRFLI